MMYLLTVVLFAMLLRLSEAGWGSFWKGVRCSVGLGGCGGYTPPPPPPCPPAKTAENYKYETVNKIEAGLKNAIQTQAPSIPELNQDPVIESPLLIEMYFSDFVDTGKTWNWTDTNSYFQTLNLAMEVNQQVIIQSAINSSQSASLSSTALAQYIQTLTNTTLSNVPSHCQNVKSLDNVEKILVDLCVNNPNFDQPTLTEAISTFYDNLDTNNVTLSEVETEKLATLILSTDDELDKLLRSMDTATREDTISSLRSTVTSLLNNSTEFKFGDITNVLDASVEKVKDAISNQSTTNKTSSVPDLMKLRKVIKLNPAENLTTEINSLIDKKYQDFYIFKLIPQTSIKPINASLSKNEGLVNVYPYSINGSAPLTLGLYTYNISVNATSLSSPNTTSTFLELSVIVCSGSSCTPAVSKSPIIIIILCCVSEFCLALLLYIFALKVVGCFRKFFNIRTKNLDEFNPKVPDEDTLYNTNSLDFQDQSLEKLLEQPDTFLVDLEKGDMEDKLPAIERKRLRQKVLKLGKDEESVSTEFDDNSQEGGGFKEEVKQGDKINEAKNFERPPQISLKKALRKRDRRENSDLDVEKKDGGGEENKNIYADDLIGNEFIDEKVNKISKECEDEEKFDIKRSDVYAENCIESNNNVDKNVSKIQSDSKHFFFDCNRK